MQKPAFEEGGGGHGMRLIVEIDLNPGEGHTMTVRKLKAVPRRLEALVAQDRDLLKALVKEALEQVLEAEMTEFLGAARGTRRGAQRLPGGLLQPGADDAGRQVRVAGAAGPQRRVLDGAVRAVSAQREGVGGGVGRDVRARGVDAQGQGDHRGAVRAQFLGLSDQRDQQGVGRVADPVCAAR